MPTQGVELFEGQDQGLVRRGVQEVKVDEIVDAELLEE